ncbi:MAG: chemotaxis protein [Oleibacter sp.]|nr:chemotaxis protein [Thalassolituus sp.]
MSIKTRLLIALLSAVVLPLAIIAVLVTYKVRDQVFNNFVERAGAEVNHIDKAFTLYLTGLAEDAAYLARSRPVRNLTAATTTYMDSPKNTFSERSGSAEAEAFAMMEAYGEARPDLAYVFLGLENGAYVQWPSGELGNYDPRKRPWYQSAIKQPGEPVRAPAYKDVFTGAPILDYLHTFETDTGLKGVVGVDVTLKKLADMVHGVKFGEEGYLILVEETGVILADGSNSENSFKTVSDLGDVYRQMIAADGVSEVSLDGRRWLVQTVTSPALGWKFVGLIPESEVFATADELRNGIILVTLVLVAAFTVIGFWISGLIARPILAVTRGLEEFASGGGNLTRRLLVNGKDESAQMAAAFNRFVASIHELVSDVKNSAGSINLQSDKTQSMSSDMSNSADQQRNAIEQVSTAFNEMVATANEVSRYCADTAASADDSQQHVDKGNQYIDQTTKVVSKLDNAIDQSNTAMGLLSEETRNITSILDTIRGIAEQTNLLALNAAIEAARAGEQGRGFAVVADEVRTLAGRTAESTEEIDSLISSFVSRTKDVSEKLSSSLEFAHATTQATLQTGEVFEEIRSSVNAIRDMANQIATAAEEQHQAAEEINRNMNSIHAGAGDSAENAGLLKHNAEELSSVASSLDKLVSSYQV